MNPESKTSAFTIKDFLKVSGFGFAYFLAHQISFLFPDSAKVLMTVWPASGIGLGILLLNPRRLWPVILVGFFIAGNAANILSGRPVANSIGFMSANILESITCAWLITRWCGKRITFSKVKELLALICAATIVNAFTATIGAGTAFLTHIASFWSFWETWWVADGLGLLLVAPLVVTWSTIRKSMTPVQWKKMFELGVFSMIWVLTLWLSVYAYCPYHNFSPQPYIFFALLAWCALRFGQFEVANALGVLAVFVIYNKTIFTGDAFHLDDSLLLKQMYLGCIGITGFLLAAGKAEQKQAERALHESEERFRSLFEKSREAMMTLEPPSWSFTSGNKAVLELFGVTTTEEFVAQKPTDLSPRLQPDGRVSAEKVNEMVEIALHQGSHFFEWKHKRINGEEFPATVLLTRIDFNGKHVLQATVRDITERAQANELLKNSEEKFSRAFTASPEAGAISTLSDGKCIEVNDVFLTKTGYRKDEVIGHSPAELGFWIDMEERRKFIDTLSKNGFVRNYEVQLRMRSGEMRDFIISSEIILINKIKCNLSFFFDITDRKIAEQQRLKLEHQMQQTQKLESLGVLAGGIAHDFNNLMGGIYGYIDIAREEAGSEKITKYLSKAMNTIERARGLTTQLLTFAKGGAPIQKIGHLFPFVQESAQFALSGSSVSCHFDIQQDLWPCNFDNNQVGQVIDNLIINAQQAMPSGGTIELTARNLTFEKNEHPTLTKGNYVRMSIKDSGIGMHSDLLTRIFDPFFTTKAKGHGLGLATCYSIINRHGGCIDVESEPGQGSTFHVYLPATIETVSLADTPFAKNHKGTGAFLIMDDENVMQETIGTMLASLGYTVICKDNGNEAVDFFLSEIKDNRSLSGMIFDLTVPGKMGGKAAVEKIRQINKRIPVFVASGYAEDPIMKSPVEYGFTASICKPFRKTDLVEMLNKYIKP